MGRLTDEQRQPNPPTPFPKGKGESGTRSGVRYAELHCHSNFSFLDGTSDPEALVERACQLGLSALALSDRDGLYGIVRFAAAAKERQLKAIFGAELAMEDGEQVVLLARNLAGYKNLCRVISHARLNSPKDTPRLPLRTRPACRSPSWPSTPRG